jgi:uncharacterized phage-associated protein
VNTPFDRRGHSVRGLANWILDYADDLGVNLTNMALNKLLFFAYEDFIVKDNIIITNAKIEAWEHGPVFREIYHAFKDCADRPIKTRAHFFSVETEKVEICHSHISEKEEERLRETLGSLIRISASRLRDMSHVEDGAWYSVWWYDGHANPGMEITPDLIALASEREG